MNTHPKILVSACLLGAKVRYDGRDNQQSNANLHLWLQNGHIISVCPEMAGGLPTPRPAAEIEMGKTSVQVLNHEAKILTKNHIDVSEFYLEGAHAALRLAKKYHITVAILKARSPSCGSKQIYDGSHQGKLTNGDGVTTCLLRQHGIEVFNESEIDEALSAALRNQLST